MVLTLTPAGLYCPAGDFYIDPWLPVGRAAITHAHADHLRWGHGRYLVAAPGLAVTRARLHPDAAIDTLPYDDKLNINNVLLSFHPAGHVLGSAQIRIEVNGEVWVVSGDYKTGGGDPTCTPFEPVRCHGFVTESTFGLPVYRWKADSELLEEINSWWREGGGRAGKRVCPVPPPPPRRREMLPIIGLFVGQGAAPARGPRPRHRADLSARRGRTDDRGVSPKWSIIAADAICRGVRRNIDFTHQAKLGRGDGDCPAECARFPADQEIRTLQHRHGERVDDGPRHAPSAGRGPRLCRLGSRRLARIARCNRGNARRNDLGNARLHGRAGTLFGREGLARGTTPNAF
jgi:hypothetical protein